MLALVSRNIGIAVLALVTVLGVSVSSAAPQAQGQATKAQDLAVPVVGTVLTGGTFAGTLNISSFGVEDGQLVARGIVSGILTTATGATSIVSAFALPVTATQPTACGILHLDLGPLFLDLLGLQVDLSRVVLDITAQSGAGNLLGNLLCAVAGLLDDPSGLSQLLNQILGALGNL